jgi:intraflagellar transport protein 140
VGDFFLGHKQYDKAVRLFTIAGETHRALDLIAAHNIPMTEEVAEALCPEVPAGQAAGQGDEARTAMLLKVAKACKRQGNYHLACKKYTQAGDKVCGRGSGAWEVTGEGGGGVML